MTRKIDTRASLATLMALGVAMAPISVAVADALSAPGGGAPGALEEIIVTATKQAVAIDASWSIWSISVGATRSSACGPAA